MRWGNGSDMNAFGQPVLDTTTTQSNVKTAHKKTKQKLSYKTKNTKKVGGGGGGGEDRVIDRRQKQRQTGSNGEDSQ